MEREKNLLTALINFLLSHGYPEESLAIEWPVGDRYRVDLAVIDPDTNKIIALFEFKKRKTQESINMAIRQLEAFSKAIKDEQVPKYVVFGKEGKPSFEIYHLKEDIFEGVEKTMKIEKIPDFSIFKNRKIRQIITQKQEDRETTLNYFGIICWFMALIVFLLLILDFLELIHINPERLTLIGVTVGLIIIPFVSKLKILGVEFERLKEKESK